MKKFIKIITIVTILCMACFSFADHGLAKNHTVTVTLPTFNVTINGHKIDNAYREYPFLVYKDITYVPMTWYDSRVLGLETNWSREKGLEIKKANVTSRYEPYVSKQKNAKSYQAQIRQGTLKLNGKTIKNESEDYPFLTFNNITYFPLTWRFAHDEFGWGYQWDSVNGLRITSHSPQVKNVGLPKVAGDNGVGQFHDHVYYVEPNGNINQIYRAPISNPTNKEKIFEYDYFAYEHMNKYVSFRQIHDQLLMGYSKGYLSHYQMINRHGELEDSYRHLRGNLNFYHTPYGKLVAVSGHPDEFNGNLHLIKKDGSIQRVGDPNVTTFFGNFIDITVVGDDVYVLHKEGLSTYKLYHVNLKTNDTKLIIDEADRFVVNNDKLFYRHAKNKYLYEANLDGSDVTLISNHPVDWFDALDGNVYYTSRHDTGKQLLYKLTADKDAQLLDHGITEIKIDHGQLFVVLDEAAGNRSLILNANGELQWDLGEPVSKLYESDDGWLIQSARDGEIYTIR